MLEVKLALIEHLARRERRRLEIKSVINKRSREKHRVAISKRRKARFAIHKESILKRQAERYRSKKAKMGLVVKTIRKRGERTPEINREELRKATARFQKNHPEKCAASSAKWYQKSKERMSQTWRDRAAKWRINNPGKYRAWWNQKYKTDPVFNLASKTRKRIGAAIRLAKIGKRKPTTSIKILGCSFLEFKKHIESQFKPGMTWDMVLNSSIHLDHKLPISSFDIMDDEQLMIAFNYKNVQPLLAADNLSKGDKILPEFSSLQAA